MLVDARRAELNDPVRADMCIIGAGAAGITLARAIRATGLTVCLLEGGGLAFDSTVQQLYDGTSDGPALYRRYLRSSRLRYFGGTTNHWNGWCRPLDEIDFEERPWIPNSGWPVRRTDLAPYYTRAASVVEIQPFDDAGDEGRNNDARVLFPEHDSAVVTKRYHFSPPTRFGQIYRRELAAADDVTVLLHANAIHLDATPEGSHVERVRARTLNGRRLVVESRAFVLAAGGIENARLLLASDSVHPGGLGNQHDLVGRYFMDHQEVGTGYLLITDRTENLAEYGAGLPVMASLALSPDAQRRHQLGNVTFALRVEPMQRASPAGGRPIAVGSPLTRFDRLDDTPGAGRADVRIPYVYARTIARAEPIPNRESRVTLDRDVDALGIRRAHLTWMLTAADRRFVWRSMEVLAQELARRRRGRVLVDEDESVPWQGWSGGSHHLGTTRMSDDPRLGVVDRDGRVHGIDNLYVAGSSVFPTAGSANPTLTIVALALRLADHLRAELPHV